MAKSKSATKPTLAAIKPLKPRIVICVGGPWAGLMLTTRIPMDEHSLQLRVKSDPRVWNTGRYKMGAVQASWEPNNV